MGKQEKHPMNITSNKIEKNLLENGKHNNDMENVIKITDQSRRSQNY